MICSFWFIVCIMVLIRFRVLVVMFCGGVISVVSFECIFVFFICLEMVMVVITLLEVIVFILIF